MITECKHCDFLADMKSLLDGGKFSDFTITCHGRVWNVHKAIICTQSEPLEAASKFGKEAEERSVDLPDDELEIVEYMLQFMYGRDYRLPSDDAPRPFWIRFKRPKDGANLATEQMRTSFETRIWSHSPEVLQKLRDERSHLVENCEYKVLDYFPAGITGYPAVNPEIESALENIVSNAYDVASRTYRDGPHQPVGTEDCTIHAKVYSLTDKYFVKGLKDTARDKFESCMRDAFASSPFYDAVEVVFSTTPDTDAGLRDLVIRRISEEKNKCYLAANPGLDKALKEIPDLAYGVLRYEDTLQYGVAIEAEV